jgi:phosphatidylglycerophosphate synthase
VRTVPTELLTGLLALAALLAALGATVGLGPAAVLVGLAYGCAVTGLLARGAARVGTKALTPADRITLARAVLVGGLTALVTESVAHPVPPGVVAGIAAAALVLDAVDGRVARGTGTATALGARFDVEVDAALVLVLSVFAARWLGPWVLLPGAAHYLLLIGGHRWPWLRRPTPPRPWCKVVAAVQGTTLTAVAAGVLPGPVAALALAGVTALLAESFGREVWWLWRAHRLDRVPRVGQAALGAARA